MDNIKDNKGTPLKRTALNNDFAKENNSTNDHNHTREINTPKPATATPSIPTEMPAREVQ
ncbi:MAG TPA: hypothetical protein GXZ28_09950 [Clostridiales bacterium]|nr:hypothetical protein [Clostridiales bacterium]